MTLLPRASRLLLAVFLAGSAGCAHLSPQCETAIGHAAADLAPCGQLAVAAATHGEQCGEASLAGCAAAVVHAAADLRQCRPQDKTP